MANIDINSIKHLRLHETKTTITVDQAQRFWENNQHNRDFRPSHGQHLARQMKLGRWKASPEPIVITESGKLVNGQHRLWAIVKTGLAQEFTIIVIPDSEFKDIFSVIDQGAVRSHKDILGVDNRVLMPITFLLRASGMKKPTPEDIVPFLDSRLGFILINMTSRKVNSKIWRHNCFRAATAIAITSHTIHQAEAFKVLDRLESKNITEWPHLFSQLYMQLTESQMPLITSGRSFHNDWFIRSMYAWSHVNSDTKTIRITKDFVGDARTAALQVLHSIKKDYLTHA